jgi:hypothetical protein
MSCRKFEIMLPDYAAGLLYDSERESLERHLETCLACREELAGIRSFMESATTEPGEELDIPEGYFDRVWPDLYSRIQDEKLNEKRSDISESIKVLLPVRRIPGFQAINLVLIAVVCVLLIVINNDNFQSGTPQPQLAQQQQPQEPRAENSGQPSGAIQVPEAEQLGQLGRYLDPAKQREMYESLTDFLANKILSIEEQGPTSTDCENTRPERVSS